MLAAANLEIINPEQAVDLSLPRQPRYEMLQAKYAKMINELSQLDYRFWERRDFESKNEILILLEKINQHKEFGKSSPKIDLEWLLNLLKVYRMEEIRSELNKASLWLKSNPDRRKKNYRKFLANWLSRAQQKQEIHYHIERNDE